MKLVPEGHRGPCPLQGAGDVHHPAADRRPEGRNGVRRLRDAEDLKTRAKFVRVTSAGFRESHVHDVSITKEAPNYRLE